LLSWLVHRRGLRLLLSFVNALLCRRCCRLLLLHWSSLQPDPSSCGTHHNRAIFLLLPSILSTFLLASAPSRNSSLFFSHSHLYRIGLIFPVNQHSSQCRSLRFHRHVAADPFFKPLPGLLFVNTSNRSPSTILLVDWHFPSIRVDCPHRHVPSIHWHAADLPFTTFDPCQLPSLHGLSVTWHHGRIRFRGQFLTNVG